VGRSANRRATFKNRFSFKKKKKKKNGSSQLMVSEQLALGLVRKSGKRKAET